jgi:hypothetical protein
MTNRPPFARSLTRLLLAGALASTVGATTAHANRGGGSAASSTTSHTPFAGQYSNRVTNSNSSRSARNASARTKPGTWNRFVKRLAGTGPARVSGSVVRQEIRSYTAYMESDIRQRATPFVTVVNSIGRMTRTRAPNYKAKVGTRYELTRLGNTGEFSMHLLMPVSGHTGKGMENALKWGDPNHAEVNHFDIAVTHADGSQQKIENVKATGLVTPYELNLALKPGKTIVQFWAQGSGKVDNYKAGREVEFHWDGK